MRMMKRKKKTTFLLSRMSFNPRYTIKTRKATKKNKMMHKKRYKKMMRTTMKLKKHKTKLMKCHSATLITRTNNIKISRTMGSKKKRKKTKKIINLTNNSSTSSTTSTKTKKKMTTRKRKITMMWER
jgi:hypothetical protein